MKNIKAIMSAMLLFATTARAQQAMTVETENSKMKFKLTSRFVLDLTGQKPIARTDSESVAYNPSEAIVLYLSEGDVDDAISTIKEDDNVNTKKGPDGIYDLSGRKVSGRLPKGIYIKKGKKVVLGE